jgi:ribosomal-protein-alanine N-acetyltransferase
MPATTPRDFSVRALEARDVPVFNALLPDIVSRHWSATGLGNALATAHQFRVLVQHRPNGEEELAGIAEYQQIVDEGHLLGIAVVPALWGGGLGTKLLLAVMAEMRAEGCLRCLLEVRRSNAAGQALYQRVGFKLDGVRRNYYPPIAAGQPSEDALLYSCPL